MPTIRQYFGQLDYSLETGSSAKLDIGSFQVVDDLLSVCLLAEAEFDERSHSDPILVPVLRWKGQGDEDLLVRLFSCRQVEAYYLDLYKMISSVFEQVTLPFAEQYIIIFSKSYQLSLIIETIPVRFQLQLPVIDNPICFSFYLSVMSIYIKVLKYFALRN